MQSTKASTFAASMSALGQKQTFALHQHMSALPPKAILDTPFSASRY